MKYFSVLPLAALASAIVLPDERVLSEISIEANHRGAQVKNEVEWTKDEVLDSFKKHYNDVSETVGDFSKSAKTQVKSALDEALGFAHEAGTSMTEQAFDVKSWLESEADQAFDLFEEHDGPPHHGPPHHGPPHDGPPHHGPPHHGPPHDGPPHHGPGKKPHHPPHHHKPNQTVYQLISESKYTTKLAKLINDYPDLVEALNGTEANYTVFAPTDRAFEKIPEHAPKPSKEQLEAVLKYHVSPEFFPAGRVLVTHTIPTLLKGEHLSDKPEPQRLAVKINFKGLTLNFYSRIVAIDIFGTNGVIHGVDTLLIPPPNVIKIIDLLPTEFSTLELGLAKTGLLEEFNTTHHPGGTLFAPSNFAFAKLGPRINAFLFSDFGKKYLKALLKYHVVPKTTLYSDAIYQASDDSDDSESLIESMLHELKNEEHNNPRFGWGKKDHKKSCKKAHKRDDGDDHHHDGDHKRPHIPKGYYHYTLPTLLEDQVLEVDVARYGGFISIKINGFGRVVIQDGIAEDGVIQVVGDVLIPPKNKLHPPTMSEEKSWFGKVGKWFQSGEKEMTLEDFQARLAPFVEAEEVLEGDFKGEM